MFVCWEAKTASAEACGGALAVLNPVGRQAALADLEQRSVQRIRLVYADAFAVSLLLALSLAVLGPVLLHFNTQLIGIGGDGPGAPAGIARTAQALSSGGLLAPLPTLIAHPFRVVDPFQFADPLWWTTAALLSFVLSPVGATNAMVLAAFFATAVAAYFFLRLQGFGTGPSVIGAVIYAFAPLRLAEAQEHYLLLDGFWLVLEAALLVQLGRSHASFVGIGLGVCLALTELDNPYLAYFGGLVVAGWALVFAVHIFARRQWRQGRAAALSLVVALVVAIIILVPTQVLPLWQLPSPDVATARTISRPVSDLDRLSLRWWNFFLPFPYNPVLGPLGRPTFQAHLGESNISEQSTMVGYVALVLAALGLWTSVAAYRKRRRAAASGERVDVPIHGFDRHRLLALAGTCIVVGVLFGLPPAIDWSFIHLPTPPLLGYRLFPEIRTTSRIAVIIQFGVSILAAFGMERVIEWRLQRVRRVQHTGKSSSQQRLPGRGAALGITSVALMAIVLEYADAPPWRSMQLLPAPAIVQWLAQQPDQRVGVYASYPLASFDTKSELQAEFYAYVVHHHPIFVGMPDGTPADALRRNLEDVLNPTAPGSWMALGVKMLGINQTFFELYFHNHGLQWSNSDRAGWDRMLPVSYVPVFGDGSSQVYQVDASPARVVPGMAADFSDAELRPDGRLWRWMAGMATIWLYNPSDQSVSAVIWTVAHNNTSAHALQWSTFDPVQIPVANTDVPVAIAVDALPGLHSLTMLSHGGATPLKGGSVSTPVSVQLRSLEPAPVRTFTAAFTERGVSRLALTGESQSACSVGPGGRVNVALLWLAQSPTTANETVFVHLLTPTGALAATADGPPNFGASPTALVVPGSRFADVHIITVPSTAASGRYQVQIGLYNSATGDRLLLTSGNAELTVGTIDVVAGQSPDQPVPCAW